MYVVYIQSYIYTLFCVDSQFPLTIQGPYPLCEITNMYVTRTTTISTIKDNIMKTYNYGTVNEFDIVLNGRLLVKESVEKNQIGSSDVIVVAERIGNDDNYN